MRATACAAAVACSPWALAQTAAQATEAGSADPAIPVQSVVIKGQGLRAGGSAYSSTRLDAQQVRDEAASQPEQLLRRVPGVEVRGYHLGGVVNVITIRGFSGGGHGGDLGMVLDGIPLNEAMSHDDGYADLNVVVPLEIGNFEVFRGPVSALYGNFNRGGLIAIETRRGGRYSELDTSLGSFSTVDVQAALGTPLAGGSLNAAAQLHRTGDYRPDSKFTRGTASARWTVELTPGSSLSLSGRTHQGEWTSASYLPRTQFDGGDTYGRDPRVVNDGGSKHFSTLRVDYNQQLGEGLKLLSFAYATQQDYSRFFTRPQNISTWRQREETYERRVAGAGANLNGSHRIADIALSWVVGAELYRESTDYLFFEGSKARARQAPASYNRQYDFNSGAVFGEWVATVAPWLRPTLGLRYDRFTGQCRRQGSEIGADPCDRLNPASRTTPKLGLRSTIAPGFDLRASQAEGFALPPEESKYAPGGARLKPTVFKQSELGASYVGGPLRADLAAYRITSSNEVRAVSPGVYENFGRTLRRGVEVSVTFTPLGDVELGWVANAARTRVLENINPAVVGKQVTGVPRLSTGLTAAWRPASGWGASAELRKVADSAVNATNTVFYGSYQTLDLGLQYAGSYGATRYRAYMKVDNAADRKYASNAFVIGGQVLVAPAAPRSVQIGLQTDF